MPHNGRVVPTHCGPLHTRTGTRKLLSASWLPRVAWAPTLL